MIKKYQDWIDAKCLTENPKRKCADWTLEMQAAFPELKRVRGWVDTYGGENPHWWLMDEEGCFIDPTASQFVGIIAYRLYDESLGEPKGKCMNCGEWSYHAELACSDRCAYELDGYYNTGSFSRSMT
jgi:hypothetical protein